MPKVKRAGLSQSLEDYLEVILNISAEKKVARPKEISSRLKVKGSSVTGALRALAKQGLINYTPYDFITLTAKGKKIAAVLVKRHRILRIFFTEVLGCKYQEAENAACLTEHVMNAEMTAKLAQLTQIVKQMPQVRKCITDAFAVIDTVTT